MGANGSKLLEGEDENGSNAVNIIETDPLNINRKRTVTQLRVSQRHVQTITTSPHGRSRMMNSQLAEYFPYSPAIEAVESPVQPRVDLKLTSSIKQRFEDLKKSPTSRQIAEAQLISLSPVKKRPTETRKSTGRSPANKKTAVGKSPKTPVSRTAKKSPKASSGKKSVTKNSSKSPARKSPKTPASVSPIKKTLRKTTPKSTESKKSSATKKTSTPNASPIRKKPLKFPIIHMSTGGGSPEARRYLRAKRERDLKRILQLLEQEKEEEKELKKIREAEAIRLKKEEEAEARRLKKEEEAEALRFKKAEALRLKMEEEAAKEEEKALLARISRGCRIQPKRGTPSTRPTPATPVVEPASANKRLAATTNRRTPATPTSRRTPSTPVVQPASANKRVAATTNRRTPATPTVVTTTRRTPATPVVQPASANKRVAATTNRRTPATPTVVTTTRRTPATPVIQNTVAIAKSKTPVTQNIKSRTPIRVTPSRCVTTPVTAKTSSIQQETISSSLKPVVVLKRVVPSDSSPNIAAKRSAISILTPLAQRIRQKPEIIYPPSMNNMSVQTLPRTPISQPSTSTSSVQTCTSNGNISSSKTLVVELNRPIWNKAALERMRQKLQNSLPSEICGITQNMPSVSANQLNNITETKKPVKVKPVIVYEAKATQKRLQPARKAVITTAKNIGRNKHQPPSRTTRGSRK